MKTKKTKQVQNKCLETYQAPLAWWGETQEKASTLSRWMALYEAVNLIADKAEEKNIPMEDISFNPLDIRDYIMSMENIYLRKILIEDYKIDMCYSDEEYDLHEIEIKESI